MVRTGISHHRGLNPAKLDSEDRGFPLSPFYYNLLYIVDYKMSKWNFNIDKQVSKENFETTSISEKIKKIKARKPKFENPKSIGLLETVFEPVERLYYDMITKDLREGFELDMNASLTRDLSNEGEKLIQGLEGTDDSLQNTFNKISAVNKVNAEKNASNEEATKNQNTVNPDKISIALADSKNFIIPDPSVAQMSKKKRSSNGESNLDQDFKNTQDKVDSIIGRAKGSSFFDNLSMESINNKGKLDALQGDINNKKLVDPNKSIVSVDSLNSPGSAPGAARSKVRVVGLGDQLKSVIKKAVNRIQSILKILMKFIAKELKYGAEKFQSFFIHFRDNFNYLLITIANALTHNNASVDEVKVFSSETMKFTTVLFTNIFLYNWYFLMFYNEDPEFRYTINVQEQVFDRSKLAYSIIGPSLRALEFFDWILLEKIPMIKNYISSKPILFFLLAIVFFILVLGNFQIAILSGFFKALTFSTSQTVLSVLTTIIVLGYGLKFICYDAGILGSLFNTHSALIIALGGIFFLILFVFYVLFIASISTPLGVLFVNTYLLVYSFFAIIIYRGSDTFTVINEIFNTVSGLGPGEEEEENMEGEKPGIVTRMLNFIIKYVKFINMFLVELMIIMILLFGINTYTSQYGAITFDKTTSINKNSISAPVNSAFTHLFTWLIIFNTLLIVFIVIKMVAKYYRLTDPNRQQQEENGFEETGE